MWTLCVLFLIILVLFVLQQILYFPSLRTYLMFRKLPGPRFPPLIGAAMEAIIAQPWEALDMVRKYTKHYPKIAAIYLLGTPFVVISDPDYIKIILSSNLHIDKGLYYQFLESWLGEGLITSRGDKWRMRRKLLNSAFHVKILEDNVGNFWKNACYMVKNMLDQHGEPIKLADYVYPCALDIICETAMGVSLNSQGQQNNDYTEAIKRTLNAVLYRIMNPHYRKDWLWGVTPIGHRYNKDVRTLHECTRKVVQERIANYKPYREVNANEDDTFTKAKERQPFLDRLIEKKLTDPETWTISDIQEEVDTFMFAGHDTSSGTAAFAMWLLGLNEEIQERAYQEQFEIFGDDDRPALAEDLMRMTYLEKVIKETLRKYPTVPVLLRTLTQDLKIDGWPVIPSESNIFISPALLHWDEKTFPEPHVFDPERFSPEECAKRHPFSFIPFSAGPRSCIGQKFAMYELKVLLSTVIRFSKIISVTKEEDVKLLPSVILHPSVPLEVIVEPRRAFDLFRRNSDVDCDLIDSAEVFNTTDPTRQLFEKYKSYESTSFGPIYNAVGEQAVLNLHSSSS